MSGHSKWHNIQAKKGKADAARGAVFTKIGREIAIAVRDGGANPESNGKLRDIIAKAKANNMPNDNIQRSIKKASGELSNVTYEQITYEGYAPGGVAVIVDTITDKEEFSFFRFRCDQFFNFFYLVFRKKLCVNFVQT